MTVSVTKRGAGHPTMSPADLEVVFFDVDDTLYQDGWVTSSCLTRQIDDYLVGRLGLAEGKGKALYLKYGTAVRGLLAEGLLPHERLDHYLKWVHTVPIPVGQDAEAIRRVVRRVGKRRWIFTASSFEFWGQKVVKSLGMLDEFEGTVDCKDCEFRTKNDQESFRAAMLKAKVSDPSKCLLFDDDAANIRAAKKAGWKAVQVGPGEKASEADLHIDSILQIPERLPWLLKKEVDGIEGEGGAKEG
eukprot:Hpha_TRINITY_DN14753_c0_g1::TRINITY_DN14753_c0_g1_i1::g.102333::m.102333/K07025/K07025; putative hydrolase of the HAD superfamily